MHHVLKTAFHLFYFFAVSFGCLSAQSSYSDFVNCVHSSTDGSWGSTCTLPGNQSFDVDTATASIIVGRAPLTIQGSGSSSTLRRQAYFGSTPNYNSILFVPSTVNLVGAGPYTVTIQNIKFDGNRANQCRNSLSDCVTYGVTPSTIDSWASNFTDVTIYTTTQASTVNISGITMVNSPGYGVFITRGTYNLNNVNITYSYFGDEGSGAGCAYLSCILTYSYDLSSTSYLPYNPVVLWSTFYGGGGGAIAMNMGVYPQIMNNQFFDNHREWPHGSIGGEGMLVASPYTTYALIYGNTLDGNNRENSTIGGTEGLEIESAYHTIESNTIRNHKLAGIGMNGVNCSQVISNTITANGGDSVVSVLGVLAVVAIQRPQAADILVRSNSVHDNYSPGLLAFTGSNGVTRIDYSVNTSDSSLFYSNTGGNVGSPSAASATWNSSCGTLP